MTETELAFASMTTDELREVADWMETISVFEERNGFSLSRDRAITAKTNGPRLALQALRLAWTREVESRYGADPWYYGENPDRHPDAPTIRYLVERIELNPDRKLQRHATEPFEHRQKRCGYCLRWRPLDEFEPYEFQGEAQLSAACRFCLAGIRDQAAFDQSLKPSEAIA